jgi:ABC-type sugar transport system substrate-binding protein
MFRIKTMAFLVLAFSLVLAACQSAAPVTTQPTAVPAATEAPAMPAPTQAPASAEAGPACAPNCKYADLVVGFLQTGSEGGWRAANTASFKETSEQQGLTLKFYDSQNDLAKQVAGFHQFIQDPEVNVIVLAALETTGWEEVLQEALDAFLPSTGYGQHPASAHQQLYERHSRRIESRPGLDSLVHS